MKIREWSKFGVLASAFLLFMGIGAFLNRSRTAVIHCECSTDASPQYETTGRGRSVGKWAASLPGPPRYLSYQPPGNGWNNQRIALENALVLARLLNRTLLVHPLAPHGLGEKLKADLRLPGYGAYNALTTADLLPPAYFLDLERMSRLVPVVAVNSSHPQFMHRYGNLTWRNVCHSAGFGYWVDRPPERAAEVDLLSRQRFFPNTIWREKCPEEQKRAEIDPKTRIVRYVSDLERDESQMIYFEQGTLFAVHIRFTTRERALEAQEWVLDHVQYSPRVWRTARAVANRLGPFNAVHVRRNHHVDKALTADYWLDRMSDLNFSTSLPLYIATDVYEDKWFRPFTDRGYKIFTARDFASLLDFSFLPESLRGDYLGIHEQCICELAVQFIPSPASTFAAYIQRRRGEVETRDGLITRTLHTYWIGHQAKKSNNSASHIHVWPP